MSGTDYMLHMKSIQDLLVYNECTGGMFFARLASRTHSVAKTSCANFLQKASK